MPPGRSHQPSPYAGRGGRGRAGATNVRWRGKSTLAKAGYVGATLLAVIVMVIGIGAYAEYRHLEGNITVVQVGGLSGRTVYGAQNMLVLGSQTRAGQKGYFGVAAGDSARTSNSDNLLLVHLDPTHTHATILSIPRDLFVYEPACKDRNRFIGIGTYPAQTYPPGNLIDGALNIGGPTCSVKTVEDLTGIKFDHFVEFDFNSFRYMVDAIGGVEVCVPKGGYHDPNSHINLSKGIHLLKWNRALAYVRTRDSLGGADAGGDLPRIELQQSFISSVIQKVNKQGILHNAGQLLSIANTATKALTVDSGLGSVNELLGLARSLVHLKSKDVSLITLPTTAASFNSAHLMAVQPQDDVVFQMLRTGQIWRGHLPVRPYRKVSVRVLNATGLPNLASRTAASLRKLGFNVVGVGDAAATTTTTVDFAGLAQADGAYTLMTALKSFSNSYPLGQNTLAEPASQLGTPGPVTLTLGTDFNGVDRPAAHKSATQTAGHGKKHKKGTSGGSAPAVSAAIQNGPGAVQSRNAGANICSGLPHGSN